MSPYTGVVMSARQSTSKRAPGLDTLVRICQRMGVTPNDLLPEKVVDQPTDENGQWRARAIAAHEAFSADEIAPTAVALEAIADFRRSGRAKRKAPRPE